MASNAKSRPPKRAGHSLALTGAPGQALTRHMFVKKTAVAGVGGRSEPQKFRRTTCKSTRGPSPRSLPHLSAWGFSADTNPRGCALSRNSEKCARWT